MTGTIDNARLLTTVNASLAREWHPTLNCLNLNAIYANSGKKAWWLCNTCSHHWLAQIASRNRGRGCPNCAGKILNSQNSFVVLYPELANEYDSDLNQHPIETIKKSHGLVWWRCRKEKDHSWRASVMNRTRQGDGCPYCSGRYATIENNFAKVYPLAAESFDEELNYPLEAKDLTPHSSKKVHWRCADNHRWQASVASRTERGVVLKCPQCKSNEQLLKNSHAHIALEYSHELNSNSLDQLKRSSNEKVWWQCMKDSSHQWQAKVKARTRSNGTGCPQCSARPRTSKIEKTLREFMRERNMLDSMPLSNIYVPLAHGKQSEIDIYGTYKEYGVVIEYDSWWWHSGEGSAQPYEKNEARDLRKTQDLLASGYIVIRIREQRKYEGLPFIPVSDPALCQVAWRESDGMEELLKKIEAYLHLL